MNTGIYCWVDSLLEVQSGPRVLPQNWTNPETGVESYNINNDAVWGDPALLAIGWYPYVLVDPAPPVDHPEYYLRTLEPFNVQATEVTQTAIYTQYDIEQVRLLKNDELRDQIVEISANALALDPSTQYAVQDDAVWLTGQQADLARLEVWQDVADFNTVKPEILVLSNNYVGGQYVEQGIQLDAQNKAAVAAGLPAPYNEPAVASFISSNQPAAGDSSGATPPIPPTYKIRQAVATVSQSTSRIWIFRLDREDPNPALRTTYRIRIENKQDARPLYVFSYTGATYLTWHLFAQQPVGYWEVEAAAAEWQYVPSDMAFIFSYGANPAVEADFFTERVEFPAGVLTESILVSWDKA